MSESKKMPPSSSKILPIPDDMGEFAQDLIDLLSQDDLWVLIIDKQQGTVLAHYTDSPPKAKPSPEFEVTEQNLMYLINNVEASVAGESVKLSDLDGWCAELAKSNGARCIVTASSNLPTDLIVSSIVNNMAVGVFVRNEIEKPTLADYAITFIPVEVDGEG